MAPASKCFAWKPGSLIMLHWPSTKRPASNAGSRLPTVAPTPLASSWTTALTRRAGRVRPFVLAMRRQIKNYAHVLAKSVIRAINCYRRIEPARRKRETDCRWGHVTSKSRPEGDFFV